MLRVKLKLYDDEDDDGDGDEDVDEKAFFFSYVRYMDVFSSSSIIVFITY